MIDAAAPFAAAPLGPSAPLSLGGAARIFFSKRSPRVIVAAVAVPLAVRVALAVRPTLLDAAIVVGVLLVWAVQEWWAHKHLLHIKPIKIGTRELDLYFAREHRRHHREPWNLDGALLPLRVLLTAIPVNAALWWLLAPSLDHALVGITAYSAMALLYEWTHYLTHTPYAPRGWLYRRICKAHRLHHFKNEGYWYGFTLPFVDDVMGTSPSPSSVPTSPTCKTLGVDRESARALVL